jgi:hypothetical protein
VTSGEAHILPSLAAIAVPPETSVLTALTGCLPFNAFSRRRSSDLPVWCIACAALSNGENSVDVMPFLN